MIVPKLYVILINRNGFMEKFGGMILGDIVRNYNLYAEKEDELMAVATV
jgi:hypothetical protein